MLQKLKCFFSPFSSIFVWHRNCVYVCLCLCVSVRVLVSVISITQKQITAQTSKLVFYIYITRGLSPPARYRLPTPRNRLRGSHSDRFARSLCYDSRHNNITHKFEFGICIIVYHPFSPT